MAWKDGFLDWTVSPGICWINRQNEIWEALSDSKIVVQKIWQHIRGTTRLQNELWFNLLLAFFSSPMEFQTDQSWTNELSSGTFLFNLSSLYFSAKVQYNYIFVIHKYHIAYSLTCGSMYISDTLRHHPNERRNYLTWTQKLQWTTRKPPAPAAWLVEGCNSSVKRCAHSVHGSESGATSCNW